VSAKVVFLARDDDLHADAVLDHCGRLGLDVIRFDVSRIQRKTLRGTIAIGEDLSWSLESNSLYVDANSDIAIFCRDFELSSAPSTLDLERSVIFEEWRSFLNGWAGLVPKTRWLDHPTLQAYWDNKLLQTSLAKSIGFKVPKTIATNVPQVVRDYASSDDLVIKQLSNMAFLDLEGKDEFIYTTPVDQERLKFVDEVANCPVLIQERIKKVADLRVTVVGDRLFPALIRSNWNSADAVDFRAVPEESFEEVSIPPGLGELIRKIMHRMELRYAAFDFGVTASDEYVFFEANVCGNWLWIEHATGLGISSALAQLLARI
jgi:hypothetical protein